MKKNLLSALIVSAAALSATSVFAALPPSVADDTVTLAEKTIKWTGNATDSIPGDNIIITGEGGDTNFPVGKLKLNALGQFSSVAPIKIEAHPYDSATGTISPDTYDAQWTVAAVDFTWGANTVTNALPQLTVNKNLVAVGDTLEAAVLEVEISNTIKAQNVVDVSAPGIATATLKAGFFA